MARDLNIYGGIPKTLSKEQRELLKPQTGSVWGCYRRVWNTSFLPHDHDIGAAEIKPFTDQMLKDRRESCFFVEYQEGMEWEAANDLQRLKYENRNLKRSFTTAVLGLYISALAAFLNFIGIENFVKLGKTIYEWIRTLAKFFA